MSSPPHSSPPINGSGELSVGLNSSGNLDGTNLLNSNYTTTINTPNNPTTTTTTTNNNIGKGSSIAADGDLLYEETRKGVRESASIMEFMKKRVKIEEDYARALLQLCKSFPMGSKYELPTNLFIILYKLFSFLIILVHILPIINRCSLSGSAIGESFSNLLECTAKQAGYVVYPYSLISPCYLSPSLLVDVFRLSNLLVQQELPYRCIPNHS